MKLTPEQDAQAGIRDIEEVIEFGVGNKFDIREWSTEFYMDFCYGNPIGLDWILENKKDLLDQFKAVTGFDLEADIQLAIKEMAE